MNRKTIWIDVTDFLKWQGAFTGFQHIQFNVAKLYLEDGMPVKFFVYKQDERRFVAVDFDPDEYAHNGMRKESAGDNAPASTPSAKSRSIALAKRYLPASAKRAAKSLLITASGVRRRADVTNDEPEIPFASDEVVVVLGGIWHGTFAEDMARAKAKAKFKFVHIIHDMIPVVCPQYVVDDLPEVFAAYKDKIFRIADGLIANSESSKKDALNFMKQRKITPPNITVFRLADEQLPVRSEPVKTNGDFIVSLGTVEGRKNHAILYYAYKEAAKRGIELPTLYIAGRIGWLIDDIRYVISKDPEVNQKIVFLGPVTNGQRAWLLENCQFSVWSSFYEGWGMPIAESLAYGKACIVSVGSSMPEVGGDLCEYLSPHDSVAWMEKIAQYSNDSERRHMLEKRIQKEYKTTSWRQMYTVIARALESV